MALSSDVFEYREPWRGPLLASAVLHGLLFGAILVSGLLAGGAGSWGENANGGAMTVTISSSLPLPAREAPPENVVANESEGKAVSIPKTPPPEPEAVEIPERIKPVKPEKTPKTPTREKPIPEKLESNKVPFGQGGPVAGPYTVFKSTLGSGGMTFGAGGSFGTQFGWYVDTVRRKISENWLKYEVDPSIQSAPRVYLTFEINRTGEPSNIRISQSSGVPSLDQSAVRALQRIDTFGPLPDQYRGSSVNVEFWFDYHR